MDRKNKDYNILMWVSQLVSATADLPQYFRASVGKLGLLGLLRISAISLIIGNTNFESHLSQLLSQIKGLPGCLPVQETPELRVRSLGRGDPLEQGMAHSSILAWKIPWAEEPDGYSPWGYKELDMTEHACKHTSQIKRTVLFIIRSILPKKKKHFYCYCNLNFIVKILFFLFIYKCQYP